MSLLILPAPLPSTTPATAPSAPPLPVIPDPRLPVSRTLLDALAADSVQWQAGMDVLASDERTSLEDPTVVGQNISDRLAQGAQVTLDVTSACQRSLMLTLRSSDTRYLTGLKGYPSAGAGSPVATGLLWYGVRYRPWLAVRTGWDAQGAAVWTRTNLGIFVLDKPTVQVSATGTQLQVTLLDKAALLQKPYLLTAANLPTYTTGGVSVGGYAGGTSVDSAMTDLATRCGVPAGRITFEPSTTTLPADYPIAEGDEPWTHLKALAASIAHILYFDANGTLVRRANPLTLHQPSTYTFTPGPTATFRQVSRATDLSNTYNHIIVLGGSSSTALYRGEASVTDASSPYHSNQIGDRVVFVGQNGRLGSMTPDPLISSAAQAQQVAQTVLAAHLGQQETVTIAGRSIPTFEGYDRVSANVAQAGIALDLFVQQCVWRLGHQGMSLTAARWVQVGS